MKKYAIALGMFDGVHIGHKAVLSGAVKSEYRSVAVTFDSIPHKNGGSLLSREEKESKLKSFGVDEVLFLNFFEVKDLSPDEFLDMLAQRYAVGKICCGFNYRFGKKAAGDTAFLRAWCAENGAEFFECPEVKKDGHTVSSTYIKNLLLEGRVEQAADLLGEEFSFTAPVIDGDKRGRTLGFPTANQLYPGTKAALKNGVYQTIVTIDGVDFDGVTNIGVRPTYITEYISAETYILGFTGNCYGKPMKTRVVKRLRDEKPFSNREELIEAIRQNAEYVKAHSKV